MLDERLEIVDLQLRTDDKHLRRRSEQRDRHQVPVRVVGEPLVEVLVDGDRPVSADEQHMRVTGGLGYRLGADVAARAAAVLDHERLAKRSLQPLG